MSKDNMKLLLQQIKHCKEKAQNLLLYLHTELLLLAEKNLMPSFLALAAELPITRNFGNQSEMKEKDRKSSVNLG